MDDPMSSDDLRGSAPIFTAKDVLIEVRDEMRLMRSSVDILVSQNLNERVTAVEGWQNRVIGLASSARVLGIIATVLSIVALGVTLGDVTAR